MENNETSVKKNVSTFNDDVTENGGYRYTTQAKLSSQLANKRIGDEVKKLLKQIQPLNRIIDVGCGDGIYTAEIKQAFPGAVIVGTDPAATAIKLAQDEYDGITFRVENILDKPEENDYNVGILRGVLHHLTDQEKAIKHTLELAETVIIIEPNGNNPIVKLFEKLSPYHKEHEEQSFSTKQLTKWCKQAGGDVLEVNYIGFIPFFFPTLPTRIIYKFQPLLEKVPLVRKYLSGQIVIVCKRNA